MNIEQLVLSIILLFLVFLIFKHGKYENLLSFKYNPIIFILIVCAVSLFIYYEKNKKAEQFDNSDNKFNELFTLPNLKFMRFSCNIDVVEDNIKKNKIFYLANIPQKKCMNIKNDICTDVGLGLIDKNVIDAEYKAYEVELEKKKILCTIDKNINAGCDIHFIDCIKSGKPCSKESINCFNDNKDCNFTKRYVHDFIVTKMLRGGSDTDDRYRFNCTTDKNFSTDINGSYLLSGINFDRILKSTYKVDPKLKDVDNKNLVCGINSALLSSTDFNFSDIYIKYIYNPNFDKTSNIVTSPVYKSEEISNVYRGMEENINNYLSEFKQRDKNKQEQRQRQEGIERYKKIEEIKELDTGITIKLMFKLQAYDITGKPIILSNGVNLLQNYYFGKCTDAVCQNMQTRICLYPDENDPRVLAFKVSIVN